MKKLIFCFLMVGLLSPVFSQNSSESILNEIGVMVGPGYSMINGGESWSGKIAFQIGIETQVYKWNDNSSIYAGVLYSIQGAAYEETYSDYDYYGLKSATDEMSFKGKVNLGYIYVPILYNYKWSNGFYAEGGIQPGFLINAKDKPDEGSSYDIKDYANTFEIGIPIGAGYWINDRISFGTRAVFGLTTINSNDTEMYSSDDSDRNFLLLAVARFKFNKK